MSNLQNLTNLWLSAIPRVSDLTPLKNLKKLETLVVIGTDVPSLSYGRKAKEKIAGNLKRNIFGQMDDFLNVAEEKSQTRNIVLSNSFTNLYKFSARDEQGVTKENIGDLSRFLDDNKNEKMNENSFFDGKNTTDLEIRVVHTGMQMGNAPGFLGREINISGDIQKLDIYSDTFLDLIHDELNDLKPIEYISQLRLLFLSDFSKITDLAPVSKLKKLEILCLSNLSGVTNLNSLNKLDNLRWLILFDLKNLDNILFIEDLKNLEMLAIFNMPKISEIPIKEDAKLKTIFYFNVPGLMDTIRNFQGKSAKFSSWKPDGISFN